MKTGRRHELETNQLADSLGHWADRVRPYTNLILTAILGLVVLVAVYLVAQRNTAAAAAQAWDLYFVALSHSDRLNLEELGELHPHTPVGWWSLCMAADFGLAEGCDQLFRDKVLARELLRQSADHYQQIIGETHEVTLLKQASYGLARAHECLGEIKKAEEEYQAITTKWPDTPYALAAKSRATDLKRHETKEFYDWFDKQDIRKRVSPDATGPGGKLPFEIQTLPDSPSRTTDRKPGETKPDDASGDTGSPDAGTPAATAPGDDTPPGAEASSTDGTTSPAAPGSTAPAPGSDSPPADGK
jgi:hypothetical protein